MFLAVARKAISETVRRTGNGLLLMLIVPKRSPGCRDRRGFFCVDLPRIWRLEMEPDARKRQFMIWYVLAAVLGILLFQQFWTSYTQVENNIL